MTITDLRLSEPVRLYLYGLLGPSVALLLAYGLVDGSTAALWLAVGAAVLGVTGTEAARAGVYSPETVRNLDK